MFINSFEILEDLEMIFTIEHTPAPCTSSKELLASAGHTVAGITYYSFLNSFFLLPGLEHHVPLMADICPALVGMPHLDHPICTLVLYGLLSRTCYLC